MRSFLTLAALFPAVPLPAQMPEAKPQAEVQAALKEAKARLATLADPKTPVAKDWQAAVSSRIAVLEELLRTRREQQDLLPPKEVQARKQKAARDLDAEHRRKTPAVASLTSADDVTEYERRFRKAQVVQDACQQALGKLTQEQKRAQAERQGLTDRKARAKAASERAGDDELSHYRVATAHWELQAVAAREAYLRDGLAQWPTLIEVLQMERDLARLKAERADKLLAAARKQAATLREAGGRCRTGEGRKRGHGGQARTRPPGGLPAKRPLGHCQAPGCDQHHQDRARRPQGPDHRCQAVE